MAEFREWLGQADLSPLPTAKSHGKALKKPKLQVEAKIPDEVKSEPERKLSASYCFYRDIAAAFIFTAKGCGTLSVRFSKPLSHAPRRKT